MIVYNKSTKNILSVIPEGQSPRKYNHILESDIGILNLSQYPDDNIKNYIVDNGILVRRPDHEIEEIKKYGKVLTEEERYQLSLPPPPTENEILKKQVTELQEVIDIMLGQGGS